jgi:hypothetical protein
MNKNNIIKIFVAVSYLAMIVVNALANALPINGMTTGDISNKYSNLFAPAAIAFSIWGLIYLLLAAYILYQFGLFQKDKELKRNELFNKIGIYFIISSLANISWIFSWHYNIIWLSVIFMLLLLFCLIKIADILKQEKFSFRDKVFIQTPFSVYFGWITVATIANITTFLVSIKWNGFGMSDSFWTVLILIIGATIGIIRILKDKDMIYGLVFIWAYIGILIKHTSSIEFAGQYSNVIVTVIFCIFAILVSETLILKNKKKLLIEH